MSGPATILVTGARVRSAAEVGSFIDPAELFAASDLRPILARKPRNGAIDLHFDLGDIVFTFGCAFHVGRQTLPLGAVRVDLAVATGIQNERTPSHGLHGIVRFIVDARIQPADGLPCLNAAEKQRVVRVIGESEMVRHETHGDRSFHARCGVVHADRRGGRGCFGA